MTVDKKQLKMEIQNWIHLHDTFNKLLFALDENQTVFFLLSHFSSNFKVLLENIIMQGFCALNEN